MAVITPSSINRGGNPLHEASDPAQRARDIADWGWSSEEEWAAAGYPVGPNRGQNRSAPPEDGVVPPRPGDPPTGPTGGLTAEQILEAYRRGGSYADAQDALLALGTSQHEVTLALARITPMGPGTPPSAPPAPAGAASGAPPGPGVVPTQGGGPPTARPEPAAPPGSFKQRLQGQLSGSDFFRRFGLESGVAPMWQDFASNLAQRQEFPFRLSQAMQGNLLDPDEQGSFKTYLQGQNAWGGSNTGQSLRSAADFLRRPNAPFGSQEALLDLLTNRTNQQTGGANVGSALFEPTIGALTQGSMLNFEPGLGGVGRRAVDTSLRNLLAQNPTRFESAPDFIDFLAQQGLLR